MAKFKIDLLTARYDFDADMTYLRTNITSYQQEQTHYCKAVVTADGNDSITFYSEYEVLYNIKYTYQVRSDDQFLVKTMTIPLVYNQHQNVPLIFELQPNEILSKQIISIQYDIKSNYNYSYNEKFAIHTNAQKDLSFDMDRKILYNDLWMDNPFIDALHIGTQLLLIDKYDQYHIMTITDIKFKINNVNIIYSYTCEDSFHYQLTHQQTTYNIINDPSSANFLGAKSIDFGADKIITECFIPYKFVTFSQVLYRNIAGALVIHDPHSNQDNQMPLRDVDTVYKPSYNNQYFQQALSFASNNQNPLATLISLGTELDCQLETYEYIDCYGHIKNFVGFAPIKKANPTGLKYSPTTDLQSFNLEYNGDNLTTVLNVDSRVNNDEVITMLPEVPAIFLSYFTTEEGEKSHYYKGMYQDFIDGDSYHLEHTDVQNYTLLGLEEEEIHLIGCKFLINKHLKTYYPFIRFDYNKNYSVINQNFNYNVRFALFVPQEKSELTIHTVETLPDEYDSTATYIKIQELNQGNYYRGSAGRYQLLSNNEVLRHILRYNIVGDQEKIPFAVIALGQPCYIGYISMDPLDNVSASANLYIKNYRNSSAQERLFAKIADQCPWLENRLINLDYLVNHKIMSEYARQNLLSNLTNELRIVNGRLLSYTSAYFTALHKQTQTIANMTAALDHLAAIMHADIIAPYAENATVFTYDTLEKAYNELYVSGDSNHKTALLNYNNILNDYLNKDFNAEQHFLHAVKDFQDYFNDINQWTLGGAEIHQTSLTIDNSSSTWNNNQRIYYSFKKSLDMHSIYTTQETDNKIVINPDITTGNYFTTQIYQLSNNTYQLLKIPEENIDCTYYTPTERIGTIKPGTVSSNYNPYQEYFVLEEGYQNYIADQIPLDRRIVEDNQTYIQLTKNELRRVILYTDCLSTSNSSHYYTRTQDYYYPFDGIRYHDKKNAFQGIEDSIINNYNGSSKKSENNGETYINNLDLDTLYYYGPVYQLKDEKLVRYNEYNYDQEKGQELINKDPNSAAAGTNPNQYKTFQFIPFVHNIPAAALNALITFDLDRYLELTTKQKESFPYYSFCKNPDQLTHSRNLKIAGHVLNGITPLFTSAPLGHAYRILEDNSKMESNCRWIQQGATYRSFEPTLHGKESGLQFKHPPLYDNEPKNNEIGDNTQAIFARTAESASDAAVYTNIGGKQQNQAAPQDGQDGGKNNRYYFNYYGLIAATYSLNYDIDREQNIDLTKLPLFKDNYYNEDYQLGIQHPSFYSILTKDAVLNKTDQYYCLVLGYSSDKDDKGTFFANNQGPHFNKWMNNTYPLRFNAIQYSSIIKNALNILDLSAIEDKKGFNDTIPLINLVTLATPNEVASYTSIVGDMPIVFKKDTDSDLGIMYFLILRYEPYQYTDIGYTSSYKNGDEYHISYRECDTHNIYNKDTDQKVNILNDMINYNQLANYLYVRVLKDDNFQTVTNFDNKDQAYYYKDSNEKYHLTYTYQQLQERLDYDNKHPGDDATRIQLYYQVNNIYQNTNLVQRHNQEEVFRVPIYRHTLVRDSDHKLIQHDTEDLGVHEIKFALGETEVSIDDQINTITNIITIKKENLKSTKIPQMTNGSFWYKYHKEAEWSTLFTQCLIIETQLTAAGERALIASKNCQFFLPDSGLPQENGTNNTFAQEILEVIDDTHVQLSNTYLPKVDIYKYSDQNTSETTQVTKYRLYYSQPETQSKIGNQIISVKDSIFGEDGSVLSSLCSDLKIDWTKLYVEPIGKTTYYYALSSGTTGKRLPFKMQDKSSAYDYLSGGYSMAFQLIYKFYMDTTVQEYETALQEKQELGTKLYNNYPNVLIEQDYHNDYALTSEQLFDAAQLYFKDQTYPEERYTLSLIDAQTLQGYHGQALQIGDAIQLDTDSGYQEQDDLYHSLNKFLFITDISYDLRKDDSMSVTVNTIKYQEKLLQQLVSLIR